ncbi:MAG: DUF1295 domain-containing protein [Myxococcales bacterium]|nr:DUF1295 domain-containing protein [Myxococcales bacterium]
MPDSLALYQYALWFVLIFAAINFVSLWFVVAPYGRHLRKGWGPTLNPRLAWIVMEAPSPICFALIYFSSPRAGELVPLSLAALYLLHYVYRSFIYPLRTRGGARKPVATVSLAIIFNVCNGSINAYAITELAPHLQSSWLYDPRFLFGVALFAFGYAVNHQADAILRGLRAPGERGYKIPYGGLYRWISCPNYFGEILEWIGFAIAAWTPAAAAFALFTASNLIPRAVAHHRWYHAKFSGYPRERKAVIPHLL